MRTSIKYTVASLVAIVLSLPAMSQVEGTMPLMRSLPQQTYYNPAFRPEYKFSIGLPISSAFVQYSNNGFTYNDFISKDNNGVTADLNKFYNALRPNNYINTNAQVDLLSVGLKANARLYLTFNTTLKTYNRFMMPREFTGILIHGTSEYINKTVSLSPKVESMSYVEAGWGAGYIINRNLTVGTRLKLLKGIVNATTQSAVFDISMSEEYALTIQADADFRTSGIHNLTGEEEGAEDYDIQENWQDYTGNSGFALDLGATYRLQDKINLGLSLIDIGGITWKNDVYGYSLNPDKANYTFAGVDVNEMMNDDEAYMESLSDSIAAKFEFTQGRIPKYRTALPTKMYFTATYEIKKQFSAGAVVFSEYFRNRFMSGLTVSVNKEFGRRVGTSLSYTITNNSYNNIGAGLSFNFAPFQLYFVGDNLLGAPLSIMTDKNVNGYINSMQYFNIRTGLNFVFGRDKDQEKQPHSNGK